MADTKNGPDLHPVTEELATGKNFASISTLLPNGAIQTQFIWVHAQDGKIVLNTETHRTKYRNITSDPRITVLIRDENDPYRYAEVRGEVTATTTGPQAREQIDELARKYLGKQYPPEGIKSERVILWITPARQTIVEQNKST
ncbi:PPOX class F420-dependent oxidoreductase [Haloactinomyces albus]|uniref:PPOX class probable F420-dependent enzyme n=1 Tax=Haloactinomyces albus TaxID=1352928 RepID=A0AAE3ZJ34_9ACTN|nr:PPOX class F420-dependent oxidoreductase [Haloactinomyces albus]MDR7304117.1 PPOX class probable F420-dependent enzyme [Haloactinomyces albus]